MSFRATESGSRSKIFVKKGMDLDPQYIDADRQPRFLNIFMFFNLFRIALSDL